MSLWMIGLGVVPCFLMRYIDPSYLRLVFGTNYYGFVEEKQTIRIFNMVNRVAFHKTETHLWVQALANTIAAISSGAL